MDKETLINLINQTINQKLSSMTNMETGNHAHNGYDVNQLDPAISLLGWPVIQSSPAISPPIDTPANGTFRFYVDQNANFVMWVYLVYQTATNAVLTGRWLPIRLPNPTNYGIVTTLTNGTNSVDILGSTAPFSGTVTGAYLISNDATAGNISINVLAGIITAVAVGNGGTGYTAGDTITLIQQRSGIPATVTVSTVDGGGAILTVALIQGGSGYTAGVTYVTSGGTGHGGTITASTIAAANTIATIAKGTVAGVMTGATSLNNPTFTLGNLFRVVSSSAGNAYVFITYTPS